MRYIGKRILLCAATKPILSASAVKSSDFCAAHKNVPYAGNQTKNYKKEMLVVNRNAGHGNVLQQRL